MHQKRAAKHRRHLTSGRGQALLTVSLGLALGTLLNAQAMLATAESLELGRERDLAVAVMEPVADLSHALRLDVPRRELDALLGREAEPAPSPAPAPVTTPRPVQTAAPLPTPSALRVPTRQDPLRIAVVGDSMAQVSGQSIVRLADEVGVARAELDFRFSSGLTRPDFFDWPRHLATLLDRSRPPEAFVVVFGANDAQGMQTPDGVARFGTPAWDRQYRARVAAVMTQLTAAGGRVYWVGQPVARSRDYSDRMAHLDEIYRSEAARHPGVRYVDSWALFVDEDGHYSAYLETGDGLALMRQADGIHLSRAGGDRLAAAVLDALRLDWRLP